MPDEPFIPAFMGGFSALAAGMAIVMVVCMRKKQQQEAAMPHIQPGSQFMQGQQPPYPPQMQPVYPPQMQPFYPPQPQPSYPLPGAYPPSQFKPVVAAQPAPAPRYCEHCGTQLQPGARVCQNCGSEFRER
nr:zinc ribbon domain-containing protein [Candidatus Sigynarchaeota archaeon]